jgi:hypothetical protein
VLSAGWWLFLNSFRLDTETMMVLLRVIPLACGLIQVQLAFQAVLYVFPGRPAAQIVGILVGGLLPMNLYLSQSVGNEPMAGVLSAAGVVYMLRLLKNAGPISLRQVGCLGFIIGLALLTKASSVLLLLLGGQLLLRGRSMGAAGVKTVIVQLSALLGTSGLVAGWYYLRNWVMLGSPFKGGWELRWWQDPGYRLPSDFFRFGEVFRYPVFAAINGFWDSLYSTFWFDGQLSGLIALADRPPWNYTPMATCVLWSVLPAMAIIVGLWKAIGADAPAGLNFSAIAVALYLEAMICLYVLVPVYSTAKASYTIGVTPCYAVLAAAGFVVVCRKRWSKAIAMAGLVCWAISAYAGYYVL